MKRQAEIVRKIIEKAGKYYGVGFMSSIGFKCIRRNDGRFDVYKFNHNMHKVGSLIGSYKKENLVLAAIENGFDYEAYLKEDSPSTNFKFTDVPYPISAFSYKRRPSSGMEEVKVNVEI